MANFVHEGDLPDGVFAGASIIAAAVPKPTKFHPPSRRRPCFGSAGVPETFVIDGKGAIRYQHIGDIRPEEVPMMLGKLKEAEQ